MADSSANYRSSALPKVACMIALSSESRKTGEVIQSFYQCKPELDTPYRELVLMHDEERGWCVRLLAGKKWGRQESTVEREDLVEDSQKRVGATINRSET